MADIKVARVDFRLVHGQIITKWIKYYPVNRIVVVDDALAQDDFMKEIYEMAVPKGTKFKVVTLNEAKDALDQLNETVFLLFKDVKTCARAVELGMRFSFLVIGGIPGGPGRKVISDGICLSPQELEQLEKIQEVIPEIVFRGIPEEATITLSKAKDKFK